MTKSGYLSVRRKLWLATAVVIIVAVAAIVPVVQSPLEQASIDVDALPAIGTKQNPTKRSVTLQDFGTQLGRSLRFPREQSVESEPAKVAPVAAEPPPQVDVVLLGTAMDSQQSASMAWIRPAGKPPRLVSVGDTLSDLPGEPTVVEIAERRTVLKLGRHEITLKIKGVE